MSFDDTSQTRAFNMETSKIDPHRTDPTLSKMRLPTRSLDTCGYAVEDQIPVWKAYNAPLVDFSTLDADTPGLNAAVKIWQQHSLLMVNLTCQRPQALRYSVSFRPSKEEYLILRFGRSGRMVGRIGDEPMDFLPGDVHLFDIRHPFQAISDGVDQISLYLPYSDLGYDPARDPSHLVFRAGTSANLLIKTAVEVIYAQLPETTATDASALMTGLSGMLRGMLKSGRPPEGSQEALETIRSQSIHRFILQNLTDPELSAAMLARKFGASRATLYRAFEAFGGVARFISDHRLERAKWELMTGNARRGLVRAVAEKYGFTDTGNFNRAFRRKFNASPKELMGDVITSPVCLRREDPGINAPTSDVLRLADLLR